LGSRCFSLALLEYAEDIVENLSTIDELNVRLAAAIRNTVPAIPDLPVEAQAAAISKATAAAFDEFVK
jgi:hypothetical protein